MFFLSFSHNQIQMIIWDAGPLKKSFCIIFEIPKENHLGKIQKIKYIEKEKMIEKKEIFKYNSLKKIN